jgi:DNA-directed RNA polymerase subunit RPC12/RpoP
MKAFICTACGQASYSSAELDNQTHPECPHCGAEREKQEENHERNRETNPRRVLRK